MVHPVLAGDIKFFLPLVTIRRMAVRIKINKAQVLFPDAEFSQEAHVHDGGVDFAKMMEYQFISGVPAVFCKKTEHRVKISG